KPTHFYQGSSRTAAGFTVRPKPGEAVPAEIRLTVRGPKPYFHVAFGTNEDKRSRPIPLRRVLLPWAETDVRALGRDGVAVRPLGWRARPPPGSGPATRRGQSPR